MEINQDVYSAHRELSATGARFLDFIKNNPEILRRSHFDKIVSNGGSREYTFQPLPLFINLETTRKIKDASTRIFNLITSIPQRFFRYDYHKMSQYYEKPQKQIENFFYGVDDGHLKNLLTRGDFLFPPNGEMKCLEFNVGSNLGGWDIDLLEPLYEKIPVFTKFFKKNQVNLKPTRLLNKLINHLIENGLKQLSDSVTHPLELNTAISYPRYKATENNDIQKMLQVMYWNILERQDSRFKGNLFFCNIDWLKTGNDFLLLEDKKIHLLLEMNSGDIPYRIMNIADKGNLLVYCGPIVSIMGNKLNLALLSEHENSDIFNSREREAIRKYIPWTRKIVPGETTYEDQKVSLPGFILSHKDRLVIKPARGSGGERVFLGHKVPEEKWHEVVENALKEKCWIVQEHLESRSYLFQHGEYGCEEHKVAWGFFVFGSNYAGTYARAVPVTVDSGIINRRQGAEGVIVLEVEEHAG